MITEEDARDLANRIDNFTKEQTSVIELVTTTVKEQYKLKDCCAQMSVELGKLGVKYQGLEKDIIEIKDSVKGIPSLVNKYDNFSEKLTEYMTITKEQQDSIITLNNKPANYSLEVLKKAASVTAVIILTAVVTWAISHVGIR